MVSLNPGLKVCFSRHSHCKFLTGSRQPLLQTMRKRVLAHNSTSVGLSWASLHTPSRHVSDPHSTSISLLTPYTATSGNPMLQGIGFTQVPAKPPPPI